MSDRHKHQFFHLTFHPNDIWRRKIRDIFNSECAKTLQEKLGISKFTIAYKKPRNIQSIVAKAKLFQVKDQEVSKYLTGELGLIVFTSRLPLFITTWAGCLRNLAQVVIKIKILSLPLYLSIFRYKGSTNELRTGEVFLRRIHTIHYIHRCILSQLTVPENHWNIDSNHWNFEQIAGKLACRIANFMESCTSLPNLHAYHMLFTVKLLWQLESTQLLHQKKWKQNSIT